MLRAQEVGVMAAVSTEASEQTLRDGRVVTVRPLRADDAAGVAAMWRRLDAPARRRFTRLAHLPPERAGDVALPRGRATRRRSSRSPRPGGWRV
jgi:hypothetical protein